MQFIIKTLPVCFILFLPIIAISQSTYLPEGHKHQQLLDRLDIKLQRNADLNVLTPKPISRKIAVRIAEEADSMGLADPGLLTDVDVYNIHNLRMNNSEWATGDKSSFQSKKPLFNTFYTTKANFLEVDAPDFFLALNPMFQPRISFEQDYDGDMIFLNSKGLNFRGLIAGKVGFSGYISENQERGPSFVMERIYREHQAVLGVGYFKRFKNTAVDYFDGRGSIDFTAAKYIDIQFGYDKNFIGNGYRSLFLSDFGNSYLFLKLNTRIWKLNYQNLFMELTPQYVRGSDRLLDKKYASIRHLSVNATKWLNLGLFEAVVFGRKNNFDFTYLNPIMFLRIAEQQNGSPDNALMGANFKANVAGKFQFYGQWLLDEFKLNEVRGGKGWWANKFGYQFGAKYVDAFTIKNLDLQGELNIVRPFTYSFRDSVADYSHYNQPLAHPLGSNFREIIGIVHYQPVPKLRATGRIILWEQGEDPAGENYGSNIFKLYDTRSGGDYGYTIPSGIPAKGVNAQLHLSYELKENFFIDGVVLFRKYRVENMPNLDRDATVASIGLRWNMAFREYNF